jgi:hypothetical protein
MERPTRPTQNRKSTFGDNKGEKEEGSFSRRVR